MDAVPGWLYQLPQSRALIQDSTSLIINLFLTCPRSPTQRDTPHVHTPLQDVWQVLNIREGGQSLADYDESPAQRNRLALQGVPSMEQKNWEMARVSIKTQIISNYQGGQHSVSIQKNSEIPSCVLLGGKKCAHFPATEKTTYVCLFKNNKQKEWL